MTFQTIAILGTVIALAGIAWQVYTWWATGNRVRVALRFVKLPAFNTVAPKKGRSRVAERIRLTDRPRSGRRMTGLIDGAQLTARNRGRTAVYVERWGIEAVPPAPETVLVVTRFS